MCEAKKVEMRGENYSGGYGGGASFMKVRSQAVFIPNANVVNSSLRSSFRLTFLSSLKWVVLRDVSFPVRPICWYGKRDFILTPGKMSRFSRQEREYEGSSEDEATAKRVSLNVVSLSVRIRCRVLRAP